MLCKHGEKHWKGDDPVCAFDENGEFTNDNWNCFLLNTVRGLMNQWKDETDSDYCPYGKCFMDYPDTYTGVLYIPCDDNWWDDERDDLLGALVVMDWYKSRGRTDSFRIVTYKGIREGTEQDAIEILKKMKKYHNYSYTLDNNGV
jgi:hypothetical protein